MKKRFWAVLPALIAIAAAPAGTPQNDGVSSVEVRMFPSGFKTVTRTAREFTTGETKTQVRVAEITPGGQERSSQTLRRKTAYEENGTLRKEFVDIVNRPQDARTTRDIIVYEYSPESRKIKNASWARYEQIRESDFARIVRYETVLCDENGRPRKTTARSWGWPKMRPAGIFAFRPV